MLASSTHNIMAGIYAIKSSASISTYNKAIRDNDFGIPEEESCLICPILCLGVEKGVEPVDADTGSADMIAASFAVEIPMSVAAPSLY